MWDPKADSDGWGSWGKGQPAPPHQLGGSGERCKLPQHGSGRAPAANVFSCHTDCLSPSLFILASCNCVLSCLCLYDCNTFSWYFYRSIFIWGNRPSYGARPAGPPCRRPCRQGHLRKLFKSREWILENLF